MREWSIEGIEPPPIPKKKSDPLAGTVMSSAELRRVAAEQGRPVIVAFSRGKDSIAATIALKAAGVDTRLVHMYRVPGLQFEEDSLKYFEDYFQERIWNLPHRDLWSMWIDGVHMAPWQNAIVEAANLQRVDHEIFWALVRDMLGLPRDTWVCDGVRAADSPARRMSIQRYGPYTHNLWTGADGLEVEEFLVHVVHDWRIADIRRCMELNQVQLPVDYELFGRTFDGLDYRFLKPLRDKLPEDFARIRELFPAVDLELMRYEYV